MPLLRVAYRGGSTRWKASEQSGTYLFMASASVGSAYSLWGCSVAVSFRTRPQSDFSALTSDRQKLLVKAKNCEMMAAFNLERGRANVGQDF